MKMFINRIFYNFKEIKEEIKREKFLIPKIIFLTIAIIGGLCAIELFKFIAYLILAYFLKPFLSWQSKAIIRMDSKIKIAIKIISFIIIIIIAIVYSRLIDLILKLLKIK